MSNCLGNLSSQDLGCGVSCTGLYADEEHLDITLHSDVALAEKISGLLDLTAKGKFIVISLIY